jgi:hypothetical protein
LHSVFVGRLVVDGGVLAGVTGRLDGLLPVAFCSGLLR